MTIRHGHPPEHQQSAQSGGGVANYGDLLLESCVIRDNSANDGGGIFNHGTMTIRRCAISGNLGDRVAEPGYECGSGGGIKSGFQATLVMEQCAVHGNVALGKGGSIFIACEGTARMANCTVSGNHAERDGGGVYVKGMLDMSLCTIAGNRTEQQGGGLLVRSQANLTGNLLSGNEHGDLILGGPGDYRGRGTLSANSYNWIADGSHEAAFSGDPMLGPLTDNGGDTLTHALLPDSPAVDTVPAPACSIAFDQCGQPRPVQVGSGQPTCDIGAFESQH
jgi:hypothetical protein